MFSTHARRCFVVPAILMQRISMFGGLLSKKEVRAVTKRLGQYNISTKYHIKNTAVNHKPRTLTTMAAERHVAVGVEEARDFMVRCLEAAGAPSSAAAQQATVMLEADLQGHYSHGINRLKMYVNDIRSGACDPCGKPEVLNQSPAAAWVDGHNALGATVGDFCMQLAIDKARETGVGWVAAKGSNHYGIAGHYATQALKEGFIGMSFTNTSPLMAPTRSKKAALGTNPIAVAAPAKNGDRFLLDMATTAAAVGKIEIQIRKEEPIIEGWAQGPDGHVTTDAQLAFDTGCLLPIGGLEATAGYKGYGLGAVVEVLCGITSGSLYGPHIRSWSHQGTGGPANLGQCFIAMNPAVFCPGFEGRMSELLGHLRGLEPVDLQKPVLAPGDKEAKNTEATMAAGAINYLAQQIQTNHELADDLKIPRMKV